MLCFTFNFCYIFLCSYYLILNLCDNVVFFHYIYKIVIIENSYYKKKYLYFNDANFLCYIRFFIIWFSHAIGLAKSGRKFV